MQNCSRPFNEYTHTELRPPRNSGKSIVLHSCLQLHYFTIRKYALVYEYCETRRRVRCIHTSTMILLFDFFFGYLGSTIRNSGFNNFFFLFLFVDLWSNLNRLTSFCIKKFCCLFNFVFDLFMSTMWFCEPPEPWEILDSHPQNHFSSVDLVTLKFNLHEDNNTLCIRGNCFQKCYWSECKRFLRCSNIMMRCRLNGFLYVSVCLAVCYVKCLSILFKQFSRHVYVKWYCGTVVLRMDCHQSLRVNFRSTPLTRFVNSCEIIVFIKTKR